MQPSGQADELLRAWPSDRPRLRRQRRAIRRGRGGADQRKKRREAFDRALQESVARYAARRANVPTPRFAGDLPVLGRREEIAQAVRDHQVVVVCGETGSGKSTQLPPICLAAGRGVDGFIGHTQPRRIAARSVAARVAEELGSPLGEQVGYKVRFQDETSADTYIKLMTDGVLLAEAQSDPLFERYDTLIVDEAHERSLNIDLLMGLLKRSLERRPEFRVVITSATIDADRFARFFGRGDDPAPVIEVSGRGYPVEVRYEPADDSSEGPPGGGIDTPRHVAAAVDRLLAEGLGDTLVFLPTERDIRESARLLRGRLGGGGGSGGVEIVPLYARLSAKEQQQVFRPGAKPRVVLATNVAESSLTVPRIRSVVDTGTARVARFSAKSRVQRLPIEAVSQASANQRAGRCGRIAPGVCVRLYSEQDFSARPDYTAPEIRRTNLAGTVLRLLALRLGDLEDLPLLDRPRPDALREARKTLRELQAIDTEGKLTPLGERIGRMPVDPRVGRMILAADDEGCLSEVLVIAAALETQDPRSRPADKQEAAEASHKRFADARSDFVAMLNLWDHLRGMRGDLGGSAFRRECTRQFLSVPKVLEWEDVHRQLLAMARQQGLTPKPRTDGYGAIHRALLTGLLSGVALRRGDEGYQSPSGEGFQLWPGSGPKAIQPKWVVAAEVVETSSRFLRTVARIRPEWLPRLAEHLTDRHYRGAHWSYKQQSVLAHEKLTLFELPLSGRKTVPYGPINAAAARDVFLREALVDEQLRGEWEFLAHNRRVIEELRRLDAKLQRDVPLVDENTLLEFYAERVPDGVFDARGFRRWFRRAGGDEALKLQSEALAPPTDDYNPSDYPDAIETGGGEMPVRYTSARGQEAGGVTVVTPRELLPTIDPTRLEWAVPGLLRDRVIGLIRLLPKPLRTRLVPAPNAADRVCGALAFGEGDFRVTLAETLSREAGAPIAASDLLVDNLPDALRINVRVLDDDGEVVGEGRDLPTLRQQLGFEPTGRSLFVDQLASDEPPSTEWDFGELPPTELVAQGANQFVAYPGLVDAGGGARRRLFADELEATEATRGAVRRLYYLRHGAEVETQVAWLPGVDDTLARLREVDRKRRFRDEVAEFLAFRAMGDLADVPRSADGFENACDAACENLPAATQEIAKPVATVLGALADARERLCSLKLPPGSTVADEVGAQLQRLACPGFLVAVDADRLRHYPRYLRAIGERLRRVAEGGHGQDARMAERVRPHKELLAELLDSPSGQVLAEEVERLRWMLEEYRVSVFAQQLGTAEKVSEKRLADQAARCRR